MSKVDGRVEVSVLGPLRVLTAEGDDVTPTGTLQRRLLAFLVVRRGHVVSAAAAIDALWPSDPPADPVASLQNHMFRLRRSLPSGLIESVGHGYRLDPASVDVDSDRLTAALAETVTSASVERLRELTESWHGPAYPELDDHDEGRLEAARLDEQRIRAREVGAEARLEEGAADDLVAELAALAAEVPLRERPRALLMQVLDAAGRRAEALRVYDDFRRLLGDELGLEPSADLASRHAGLLADRSGTVWSPPTRAPVPLTALLGRDHLLSDAMAAVHATRLVTLVGPGGVGKTRLLIELGQILVDSDPDRPVVFCELARAEASTVGVTIASALGIDDRPGVPVEERVCGVVGDAALVLLLDNCEHVLGAVAPFVESLLSSCPGARVVTTTRERLRIPGELLRTVPPLAVDGTASPAVRLFVDRAAAATGDGASDPDLDRVAEIVRRLDGLPLAIELAAARLHTHALDEVASGLDRRFALLTTGSRSSSRHTSLAAAVSWSFDLLPDALQGTFAALSVFAGPFDAEGAAAVAGLPREEARSALAELVERSLVTRTPDRRYVLLETLRAFGADRIDHTGRHDDVGTRHAAHMVGVVVESRSGLVEPDGATLAVIDASVVEARRALDWLLAHDDLDAAARLVAGLWQFGFFRLRPDVLTWSEAVLQADATDASPHAPDLWAIAAYAAWMAGDIGETGRRARRAADLAEQHAHDASALVLSAGGSHALFEGRLDTAEGLFRRAARQAGDDAPALRLQAASAQILALGYAADPRAEHMADALLDEVGDVVTPCAAYAWYCAGEVVATGDPVQARARHARALDLAATSGASIVTGLAGASKASIDARLGDPVVAAADYRRLIDHWQRAGMWSTQWTMLRSVAGLLTRLGRDRDAAVLEGAVRSPRSGHRIFGADAAALDDLSQRLREALGDEVYDDAIAEGALLDGASAVEHALRAL